MGNFDQLKTLKTDLQSIMDRIATFRREIENRLEDLLKLCESNMDNEMTSAEKKGDTRKNFLAMSNQDIADRIQELQSNNAELEKKLAKKTEEYEELEYVNRNLTGEKSEYVLKAQSLEAEIKTKDDELQKLAQDISQSRDLYVEKLGERNRELEKENARYENLRAHAKKLIHGKKENCKTLERQLADFRLQLERTSKLNEDLNRTADSHLKQLEDCKNQITQLANGKKQQEADYQFTLFGDISGEPKELAAFFEKLMGELSRANPKAIGLTARLMAFRSCNADSAPSVLKEIGEAYYGWKPRSSGGPTAEEDLLTKYLRDQLSNRGIKNSIELVECGDRFDASLHATADRGAEVAVVRGWIVTRDNGKPVIRASVTLG